ncbi:DMT family transporter [bacterium]|nr:DMT family transporter [bacterium]MBU1652797.1 DMT family transporter [bacterium]MBU1881529.1 DMT family transporter [bacterium]
MSPKIAISVAVVALSFPAIFIRFANSDPLAISFLRFFFVSLLLWPIAGWKVPAAWRLLDVKDRWRVVSAGIFLGIHMYFWVTAVNTTTIASAAFLIMTQPLIVAAVGHFVLKERIDKWIAWAMGLTLLGAALINGGDLQIGARYLWGDLLAIVGAAFAGFYLLAGRSVRQKIDILPYITLVYSVAAGILLPVCLIVGTPLFSLTQGAYFWIVMLALVPTLIGHSTFNWALRYLKAFTVNISIVVEPIGATLMAWFFFREQPSMMLYPGAALLIAALYLAFKGDRI